MPNIPESVDATLFTADPNYRTAFRELVEVLLSADDVYTPQTVELGREDNYRTRLFDPAEVRLLEKKWIAQKNDSPGWTFHRKEPYELSITLPKYSLGFEPVSIYVDRAHFRSSVEVKDLVDILKQLYKILKPAYGFLNLPEMVRVFQGPLGNMKLGIDLDRALPDIYWANFFGPEYVEMFGRERVTSSPCHSVEPLADGGMLLTLTESLFDLQNASTQFEAARERLKAHLGLEYFDTGNALYKGKVPRFRFRAHAKSTEVLDGASSQRELLSEFTSEQKSKWTVQNIDLSKEFIREMATAGISLDLSPRSLVLIDDFLKRKTVKNTDSGFLMRMGAYLAQTLIQNTGAHWAVSTHGNLPELELEKVKVSPLVRAQKALLENELVPAQKRTIRLQR